MRSLALTLLLGLGLATSAACGDEEEPFLEPVDAPEALGTFAVGHLSFTAEDAARSDRSILIDVWYPVDAADVRDVPATRYPLAGPIGLDSEVSLDGLPVSARPGQTLLVFSHGYGGINIQSTGLMEALASHGFVIVSPEHTGNAQSSPDDSFDEAAANRVPDVSFVIDTMLARSADPEDAFFGRLADNGVGVVGHSFGGMTAIGMAAGWAGASSDPRVAAIVPISAVIDGDLQRDERSGPNAGFTPEELARVSVPAMLIGGTEDVGVPVANNGLAFDQMTAAPKVYRVDIIGANHTHFANICDIGDLLIDLGISQEGWPAMGAEALIEPYEATCTDDVFPIAEAHRLQNLYAVAFFRRHLFDERGYDRYLRADYADTEPAITFWSR